MTGVRTEHIRNNHKVASALQAARLVLARRPERCPERDTRSNAGGLRTA